MDGRVKTLHPRVHGGILMRELPGFLDAEQLRQIGGAPIDLVVVNLYPFSATVAKGAPFDECIENIDIGGPTMVRAAAKNHARVSVVVEPSDYEAILKTLPDGPPPEMRSMLALKVSPTMCRCLAPSAGTCLIPLVDRCRYSRSVALSRSCSLLLRAHSARAALSLCPLLR